MTKKPFSAGNTRGFPSKKRRQLILAAGACAVAFGSNVVSAADPAYPKSGVPIRLVSPYTAGGGTDTLARALAPALSQALGTTVLVENKPGAGGLIGTDLVAKAAPDGYTVLITITSLIQAPSIYKNVPFDPLKDFIPLALAARVPLALAVRADLPASNVKEFVDLAKANANNYAMGNYGTGTLSHILAATLTSQTDLDIPHVAYKGLPPLLQDLAGGQVSAGFTDMTALPLMQAGRIKFLGVSGPERMALLPQIPTLTEQGYKDFEAFGWAGIFVPAGTPAPIVERLSTEFSKAIAGPEFKAKLDSLSYSPGGIDRVEFGKMLERDSVMWNRLIKQAKIEPN